VKKMAFIVGEEAAACVTKKKGCMCAMAYDAGTLVASLLELGVCHRERR
jgi:hypothetical protein